MEIQSFSIEGVKLLKPKKFGDHRGFFMETYNQQILKEAGIDINFVQDNHSMSAQKGTLRGLHYQLEPYAQDKLVRVSRGSVLDVAVDIRPHSPTFKQYVAVVLSAENGHQLLVPKGFAHGFLTLEDNTEFLYKVSNFYAPDYDRNILWNDPELNIDWDIDPTGVILSNKDQKAPLLKNAEI